MQMKTEIQKPDIVNVLDKEGIELKQKGKYLWGLCPLHTEKTPSFKVDPDKQSFYCFGCHEHGDVITLIQKYRDLSFKSAISYLSINSNYEPNEKELRMRELIKEFKQWGYQYHDDLCRLYRALQKAKDRVKTEWDLGKLAPFYHQENIWLYQIEILHSNDEKAKFELYREVKNGRV
jgi:DNA primase